MKHKLLIIRYLVVFSKKGYVLVFLLQLLLCSFLKAQTPAMIIKPESGQSDYIISAADGPIRLEATDHVLLLPGTHITEGSVFVAKIITLTDGNEGITINAVQLPETAFEVVYDDTVFGNLNSGLEDSEFFFDLGPQDGVDKVLFVNIEGTTTYSDQNLRLTKNGTQTTVEVFENGQWLLLSPKFFKIQEDTLSFNGPGNTAAIPFSTNLTDGLVYSKVGPMVWILDPALSIDSGVLEITGPDGFSTTVDFNPADQNFVWDGTQAIQGVYRFRLQLQNKNFDGQFLIL